jgi:hypothetical protein
MTGGRAHRKQLRISISIEDTGLKKEDVVPKPVARASRQDSIAYVHQLSYMQQKSTQNPDADAQRAVAMDGSLPLIRLYLSVRVHLPLPIRTAPYALLPLHCIEEIFESS